MSLIEFPVKPSHEREQGQATIEFALILTPLLLLVVGLIQFGIAISFWQDQQRLATQGARVAVVNCAASSWCTPTLAQYLASQPLSTGNRPTVTVCFTSKSAGTGSTARAVPGDGVKVVLESSFPLVPLLKIGTIQLKGQSTMRLEQNARHPGIVGAPVCPAS